MTPGAGAGRHRVLSLAAAAALVAAARHAAPDPEARATLLYTGVLCLGYGHLLGPLLASRLRPSTGVGLAIAFCAYTGLVHRLPEVVLLPLALAVWHTAENDLALGESLARRGARPPFDARPGSQLLSLAATALIAAVFVAAGAGSALGLGARGVLPEGGLRGAALALALCAAIARPEAQGAAALLAAGAALLPTGGLGLAFPELFALVTLYHLICWGWLRAKRSGALPVLAVHALPALLAAVLLALPGELAQEARGFVFSPVIYLFWSGAHVVQTARARKGRG